MWVETIRQSVCGSCSASKGCGHGILNRLSDGHRNYLKISCEDSPNEFQVDDQVSIAIPEQLLLQSSFVVYMLPLLSMLLSAAVAAGMLHEATDFLLLLAAALGFLLGLGLVRLHAWYNQSNPSLHPRLLGLARE